MRKLTWLGIVLTTLWCGYWAAGSYALRQATQQGLAAQALTPPAITTGGFPTAFDITLQPLDFGNPITGLRWQTPDLRVQAALWQPWHIVALLSDSHSISLPTDTLTLQMDDGRASLTLVPDTSLTLAQTALTLTQPALGSAQAGQWAADVAELHVNLLPAPANSYAIALTIRTITLDPAFVTASGLDGTIARITIDGTASLSGPLDRFAGDRPPRITALTLKAAQVDWGDLTATASGSIAANADGLAEGRIDITITGWRKLMPALVATGALTPGPARTVEGFLGALAAQGGDPETLTLPLIYQNGTGMLGPLPLGPAPRLN